MPFIEEDSLRSFENDVALRGEFLAHLDIGNDTGVLQNRLDELEPALRHTRISQKRPLFFRSRVFARCCRKG